MTEENVSTTLHLANDMTTKETGEVQTARVTRMTSSLSHGPDFYFQFVIVIIGIVGVATNAVIIYAMIARSQHKKHLLIFNQNIFDLSSSLALIVVFTVKHCNIHLSGALGYWLCIILNSENLWMVVNGNQIDLMSIKKIERYPKMVHHKAAWSEKLISKWVKISAVVLAWIGGIVRQRFINSHIYVVCLEYWRHMEAHKMYTVRTVYTQLLSSYIAALTRVNSICFTRFRCDCVSGGYEIHFLTDVRRHVGFFSSDISHCFESSKQKKSTRPGADLDLEGVQQPAGSVHYTAFQQVT